MGSLILIFIAIQFVTGILLLFYYVPSITEEIPKAYESIVIIMTEVRWGWFLRSIHSWSANLMIFTVFLHFFSTLALRSYRNPRELTWITGFVMLILSLALGFSGYLLPYDQLSLAATSVGTNMLKGVPFIGEYIEDFLRGGEEITQNTISRFFGMHVALFPLLLLLTLVIHLAFIQKQGMSVPPGMKNKVKEEEPFAPNFIYKEAIIWVWLVSILVTICYFFPASVGMPADPLAETPPGIKPEWYFLAVYKYLVISAEPIKAVVGDAIYADFGLFFQLLPVFIIAILLFFLPFWKEWYAALKHAMGNKDYPEVPPNSDEPTKSWFEILVALFLIVFAGLTLYGEFSTTIPEGAQGIGENEEIMELVYAQRDDSWFFLGGLWLLTLTITWFLARKVKELRITHQREREFFLEQDRVSAE